MADAGGTCCALGSVILVVILEIRDFKLSRSPQF